MLKSKDRAFGRDVYLLGRDKEGNYYWFSAASWDCGWYWGGGYVSTYTNQTSPSSSRDITLHTHFDSMFFDTHNKNGHDVFKELLVETPFSDSEIWQICELMKSFYVARNYADMIHRRSAGYTANPASDILAIDEHAEYINKIIIPGMMERLYAILY